MPLLIPLPEIHIRVSKEHHASFVVSNQERSALFDQVRSVFNVRSNRNLGKELFPLFTNSVSLPREPILLCIETALLCSSLIERTPADGNKE